jgi:hypothetical protein
MPCPSLDNDAMRMKSQPSLRFSGSTGPDAKMSAAAGGVSADSVMPGFQAANLKKPSLFGKPHGQKIDFSA